MITKMIRFGSIVALIGFAVLLEGQSFRTTVRAQRFNQHINLDSFAWGINQTQFLRICVGNNGSASSDSPRENISLVFTKIQTQSGDVILERELTVPRGQFRCTDFTHPELVATGLAPEPSTRVQFLVNVGLNETLTVGAAQEVTIGSAETITIDTGRTKTYKTIQTRQTTVVQDLQNQVATPRCENSISHSPQPLRLGWSRGYIARNRFQRFLEINFQKRTPL